MPGTPAAFIDRDGVLNEERGYVFRIGDFALLPGAIEGLKVLQTAGYLLVVLTNQSGIARGLYSESDYQALTRHMREVLGSHGVVLSGVYHCPHHPTQGIGELRIECDCRKPRPGLLLRAQVELGLDLSRSVIIGDKRSDIDAGRAAALAACVLVRSGHAVSADDAAVADACLPGLYEAARWLVSQKEHSTHQ
jgi:D-glycero-D-manno-heptose 1,7-bisphosphate phosphatase